MRICTARPNLRAVTGLSAAFGLALTLASLPAAAQQWTPKQRAACEPDAMRLCNQYIPDVQRVSVCEGVLQTQSLLPRCNKKFAQARLCPGRLEETSNARRSCYHLRYSTSPSNNTATRFFVGATSLRLSMSFTRL